RIPADKRTAAQKAIVAKTDRLLVLTPQAVHAAMAPDDRRRHQELQEELKKFDSKKPVPLPVTLGLAEAGGPPPKPYPVERGGLAQPGGEVAPGFPVLPPLGGPPRRVGPPPPRDAAGRRAGLARWIASRENPLPARVLVNRLWQHHFGQG